jgi:hypothetical protein
MTKAPKKNIYKSEPTMEYYMSSSYLRDLKNFFWAEYENNKNRPMFEKLRISLGNTFLYDLGTTVNHIAYMMDRIWAEFIPLRGDYKEGD